MAILISYEPLWKTMRRKGVTPYALRYKYGLGGGTIQRLLANETISTNTLDVLCKTLDCPLHEIAVYVTEEGDGPDETLN